MITLYAVVYMDNVHSLHMSEEKAWEEANKTGVGVMDFTVTESVAEMILFGGG